MKSCGKMRWGTRKGEQNPPLSKKGAAGEKKLNVWVIIGLDGCQGSINHRLFGSRRTV